MWSRYVALGDSFTEGLMDVTDDSGRHRGWADRLAGHLAMRDPDFQYANLAIRGRTAPQVVGEQVPAALRLRPDLVTLAVGINDALRPRYDVNAAATHVENAAQSLRAQGTDVVLFAFGDPSRKSRVMGRVRERILQANAATRAIAERYGCHIVDFWGCAVFDADELWDDDRLHLSPEGHRLASLAVLETLGLGTTRGAPRCPGTNPPCRSGPGGTRAGRPGTSLRGWCVGSAGGVPGTGSRRSAPFLPLSPYRRGCDVRGMPLPCEAKGSTPSPGHRHHGAAAAPGARVGLRQQAGSPAVGDLRYRRMPTGGVP